MSEILRLRSSDELTLSGGTGAAGASRLIEAKGWGLLPPPDIEAPEQTHSKT